MPEAAPVTIATLSFNFIFVFANYLF